MKYLFALLISVFPAFAGVISFDPPSVRSGGPANGYQFTNINAGSVTGLFSLNISTTTPYSATPGDTELAGNNAAYAAGGYGFVAWAPLSNSASFYLTTVRIAAAAPLSGGTNCTLRLFRTTDTNPPANAFTSSSLYSNQVVVHYNGSGQASNSLASYTVSPAVLIPSGGYIWGVLQPANSNQFAVGGNVWYQDANNTNYPRLTAAVVQQNGNIILQNSLYTFGNVGIGLSGYMVGTTAGTAQDAINVLAADQTAMASQIAGGSVSNMSIIVSSNIAYIRCQWGGGSNWVQRMELAKTNAAAVQMSDEYFISESVLDSQVPGTAYSNLKSDTDDACPINIYQTYIGGNHGLNAVDAITATAHGKTAVDVGSVWKDADNTNYTLISIPDANTLWMIQEFGGSGVSWTASHTLSGLTLTHVIGATHTGNVTVESDASGTQMKPAVSNELAQVWLNGKTLVTADGSYPCDFVDVVNCYNIFNPPDVVAFIQSKVGSNPAPAMNDPSIKILARVTVRYRYSENGACTVFQTIKWVSAAKLGYAGFVQAGPPTAGAPTSVFACVPGSIYTNWYALSNSVLDITTDLWISESSPPSRFLEMYSPNGTNSYGYELGYAPLGLGIDSNRVSRVNIAGEIYSTEKMYPRALEWPSTNYPSGVIASNEVWDVVGLRTPLNPNSVPNGNGVATWWNTGGGTYFAAIDIQTNYSGSIALPRTLSGLRVVPVTAYNLAVNSLIVGEDGINVMATNGCGYCTLLIQP